jgi:E3 ubiquitin-protein ligase NEDD4
MILTTPFFLDIVIAADGLYKRDVFRMWFSFQIAPNQGVRRGYIADPVSSIILGFPDPFAVATVGGEQTHTTSVIKKTLNPYWNEPFDLYVIACPAFVWRLKDRVD